MAEAQSSPIGSVPDETKAEAVSISEKVLAGLEAISARARSELAKGPVGTNQGFAPNAARNHLQSLEMSREATRAVGSEPAIVRVEVRWEDTRQVESLFMTRGSAAGIVPPALEGRLVSYKTALGRIAEFEAGEDVAVHTPKGRRECQVLTRALISPLLLRGVWDARNNQLETLSTSIRPSSLRDLVEQWGRVAVQAAQDAVDYFSQIEDEARGSESLQMERHHQTVQKMALRDQAILDRFQGDVFRLPLERQLMLLGPPGTGKTTTLIKRLAQKRLLEALTPEEDEQLKSLGLVERYREDTSWVMYSPTELLKLYVKEAFAKERVPASSQNIRTWENQRYALAKDTLRILKSATDGAGFQFAAEADILARRESARLAALHDRVAEYVDKYQLERFREAAEWLRADRSEIAEGVRRNLARIKVRKLAPSDIYEFGVRSDDLRPLLRRLGESNRELQKNIFNRLVAPKAADRLATLAEVLTKKGSALVGGEGDDEELEGEAVPQAIAANSQKAIADELMRMIGKWAEAQVDGRDSKNLREFIEWAGDRAPKASELKTLGQQLNLRRKLQVLEATPRALVDRVPSIYRRFRREFLAEKKLFSAGAKSFIDSNQISPDEVDILVLLMLRNTRRARSHGEFEWLGDIEAQYKLQVYVDEATDFSAVQLACMIELSHPKLRSWFACGDFQQRITAQGISDRKDLRWIEKTVGIEAIETKGIERVYRQSGRLKEFADALASKPSVPKKTAFPGDPAPLLLEKADLGATAAWLAGRIVEVEATVKQLPSVAIFVDGEAAIDPLIDALRPHFEPHNLPVVACRDGQAIGDVQQVRVFDIRHVKGLEFEAVFFVGVDQLARRMPDLFDRFLYVGSTRAATFLGLTCKGALPAALRYLRPLVGSGDWRL
jgi:hypothetical protein